MGLLATVAVPSFVRYSKLSKTAEASLSLKNLVDGVTAYWELDHLDQNGSPLPRRFPVSAGPTPGKTCCSDQGNPNVSDNGMCLPSSGDWDQQGWKEARFAIDAPHRFVYEMINEGEVDGQLRTTLVARGDLDCDGIQSVFKVRVVANPQTLPGCPP